MTIGVEGFVPERLREARDARRISSQAALARILQVSASTVSRWEDGISAPEEEMLFHLANKLDLRPEYFLRATYNSSKPTFFRSQSSALQRDISFQRSQMRWLKEISTAIGHYVNLPSINVPLNLWTGHYRQLRDADIEDVATQLRRHFGLKDGPCTNVVALLERAGIIIAAVEMGTSKLDGLCNWTDDGRPHIILANDKMSFARRQMDVAHEMAHIILHHSVTEEEFRTDLNFIELQAFRLASAFLMPANTFAVEARVQSLSAFVGLKERWKVSVKAQIKRLADLRVIPEEYSTHLYKMYSAKGWTRGEPFDAEWELQQPQLLSQALQLIVSSGTRSKEELLSRDFTMPAGDIESLCNLPPGWFRRDPAEVITLKTEQATASRQGDIADTSGTLIRFPGGGRGDKGR